VLRWSWRVFRREWRQQALVLALLTFTVAGALLGTSAVYHTPDPPEARFGSAGQLIRYGSADPRELDAMVDAARAWFGTIDVIGHRNVPIPGLVNSVELRAQDPHGPYGAPLLGLRTGRYPAGAGEVAVTDEVAALMNVRVGERVALADRTRTVVGLVENPSNLDAEFVLVSPADADPPEWVTILTATSLERFDAFQGSGDASVELRPEDERPAAAGVVFGLVAVAMLLVCLVAVAGFIALAQRRRRQFGLLAATGAVDRQVRLVLLAAGAVTGAVAAALGAAIAVPVWIVSVPRLEAAAAHRIETFDLPWWLLGASVLLAVVTSTGAAWWPGRAAARVPVTQALWMRPPRPRPAHRSAVVAGVLIAAGAVCLRWAHQTSVPLIIAGAVAIVAGLPFLSPSAIRVLARAGARLPVAPRLALRDLARHQARSSAALAAISLALAVPALVVIADAANAKASEATAAGGNLSDRQIMIRVGGPDPMLIPDRTPDQTAAVEASVRQFAASLDPPTVIPLDVAVDPDAPNQPGLDGGPGGRLPVLLGVVVRDSGNVVTGVHASEGFSGLLYIATPDILRYYGLDSGVFGPGTEVVTAAPQAELVLLSDGGLSKRGTWPSPARTAPMRPPGYSSLPSSLLNPATVPVHGWTVVRAGWLIEADRPLTTAQLAAARDMALDNGLTIETRPTGATQVLVRATATTSGGVLALGVLAMTVGLIRGEAGRDLRTLTAAGATARTRRALAASTAGGLAVLGAILGIGVAYLALAAGYDEDIGLLSRVPVVELAAMVVGVPLLAAAAAWGLAGKEPRVLSRTRLD
jgi:putative ABC transport system permease protein